MKTLFKILLSTALAVPCLASAELNDPGCLTVPTETPVEDWERMAPVPLGGPVATPLPPMVLNRPGLLATGVTFSDLIYLAPDLESTDNPKVFVRDFIRFHESIPTGYELYHLIADPLSGLKYAIFKPTKLGRYSAWVLAVAGTETLLDAIADGKMGRKQMDRLVNLFHKCLFQDEDGRPRIDIPFVFTGHSLGGGVLQALYHQTQSRLRGLRASGFESPLQLVTFNAFGGQALLSEISVPYNPEYVEPNKVSNYFVTGDLVSRVGKHIGPTFEMASFDNNGKAARFDIGTAHKMKTVMSVIANNARLGLDISTTLTPPPYEFGINSFYNSQKDKYLGFALFLAPSVQYLARSTSGNIADFLAATARHISALGSKDATMDAMFRYIKLMAADEESRLRSKRLLKGNAIKIADQLHSAIVESEAAYNHQPTPGGFFRGPGGIDRDR